MSGYYKIWRKLRSHPLFKNDHKSRHFFQDLLGDVAFADTVQDWKGKPVQINRGSVMKSQRQMSSDYGFSHRETRTILNHLANHEIIKIDTLGDKSPSIISVCNWDKYQAVRHRGDTLVDTKATQRRHTKEEGEEVKEERKEKKLTKKETPSNGSRAKPKTHMTEDFDLAVEWVEEFKNKLGLSEKQIADEFDGFRNYWLGEGVAKADWKATFRNRLSSAIAKGRINPAGKQAKTQQQKDEEMGRLWGYGSMVDAHA